MPRPHLTDHRGRAVPLLRNERKHITADDRRRARDPAWRPTIDAALRRVTLVGTLSLLYLPVAFYTFHAGRPAAFALSALSLTIAVIGVIWVIYTIDTAPAAASLLRRGHCPSCGYSLTALPPDPDGCITCPECAAAWRP